MRWFAEDGRASLPNGTPTHGTHTSTIGNSLSIVGYSNAAIEDRRSYVPGWPQETHQFQANINPGRGVVPVMTVGLEEGRRYGPSSQRAGFPRIGSHRCIL